MTNAHANGGAARFSVVVETITAREHPTDAAAPLADLLAPTLGAIAAQTYPGDRIETIVVLDRQTEPEAAAIARRFPSVHIVFSAVSNYFAAKNAGAAASTGDVIALLDADCVPEPDWASRLVAALTSDVDAVAGRTSYEGRSTSARTFSVSDFGVVVGDENGSASGFNLNNLAFRRKVLLAHPFEERIRRNGGCYYSFHRLRAAGARIVYEPRAVVAHGLDVGGLGFVRKHFDRGFDGTNVYRLDDRGVLRGTPIFRRFGALGLAAITVRRVVLDWARLVGNRRQMGVAFVALPYYAGVMLMLRTIELAGGLTAIVRPRLLADAQETTRTGGAADAA